MADRSFGELRGQAVGIIMRDAVRCAVATIKRACISLEIRPKKREDGEEDWVSNADEEAQRVFLTTIRQCFPRVGIVAEEDDLRIPCTLPGCHAYFTVDPLDGTKVLKDAASGKMRNPMRGIGTMCALVVDGTVIAAYVGDIETGDVVGFHPDADGVYRYGARVDVVQQVRINEVLPLREQILLLRLRRKHDFPPWLNAVLGGSFRGISESGGSVGVEMMHVWSGEAGAAVLRPNQQTPWDLAPVVGISERLGFAFLRPIERDAPDDTGQFEVFHPRISDERYHISHVTLVVHRSRLPELAEASVLRA